MTMFKPRDLVRHETLGLCIVEKVLGTGHALRVVTKTNKRHIVEYGKLTMEAAA